MPEMPEKQTKDKKFITKSIKIKMELLQKAIDEKKLRTPINNEKKKIKRELEDIPKLHLGPTESHENSQPCGKYIDFEDLVCEEDKNDSNKENLSQIPTPEFSFNNDETSNSVKKNNSSFKNYVALKSETNSPTKQNISCRNASLVNICNDLQNFIDKGLDDSNTKVENKNLVINVVENDFQDYELRNKFHSTFMETGSNDEKYKNSSLMNTPVVEKKTNYITSTIGFKHPKILSLPDNLGSDETSNLEEIQQFCNLHNKKENPKDFKTPAYNYSPQEVSDILVPRRSLSAGNRLMTDSYQNTLMSLQERIGTEQPSTVTEGERRFKAFNEHDKLCLLHDLDARDFFINKYYTQAQLQGKISLQTKRVLDIAFKSFEKRKLFDNADSVMDAEKVLLLATYKRNFYIHKANKLQRSSLRCKCPIKEFPTTASVFVSEIKIKIKPSFFDQLKSNVQFDHYYQFIAVITFGDSDDVFCTSIVSIYDADNQQHLLLPGEFQTTDISCNENILIEIYFKKITSKISKSGVFKKLMSGNHHKQPKLEKMTERNVVSSFSFAGCCSVPIKEMDENHFKLVTTNKDVPLDNYLCANISFRPNFVAYSQGYLNVFRMFSGYPSWTRFWCVLDKSSLKMWDWEGSSSEECLVSINLNWCVDSIVQLLPAHQCPRSNTFELSLMCDKSSIKTRTFLGKYEPLSKSKTYSIWLSADSVKDCDVWLNAFNLHLNRFKDWNRVYKKGTNIRELNIFR